MHRGNAAQFGIQHARECKQIIALILQRDAHLADAFWVQVFAGQKLLRDEVEQFKPRGQARASDFQYIQAQLLGEGFEA